MKDSFGGFSTTWDKKDWDVPARIYNPRVKPYTITLEGASYLVNARLMVDKNQDIEVGDKVEDDVEDDVYIVVDKQKVKTIKDVNHIECSLAGIDE